MEIPSQLLQASIDSFSKLPGIGRKTALRLSLHILKQDVTYAQSLASSIINLKENIKYCKHCHTICDADVCNICLNPKRDHSIICVVESFRDQIAIENTHQFTGVYHILGGIISPMNGISPSDLHIESLLQRVSSGEVKEVILALSTTVEGDTTNFYLFRKLSPLGVSVTTIARGVSIGDELEYTDEITLGRSLVHRSNFDAISGK